MVALTFLEQCAGPGLWLVLTQWCPEPVPDAQGSVANDPVCRGVAMALVPGVHLDCVLRLGDRPSVRPFGMVGTSDGSKLVELAALLERRPVQDHGRIGRARWLEAEALSSPCKNNDNGRQRDHEPRRVGDRCRSRYAAGP